MERESDTERESVRKRESEKESGWLTWNVLLKAMAIVRSMTRIFSLENISSIGIVPILLCHTLAHEFLCVCVYIWVDGISTAAVGTAVFLLKMFYKVNRYRFFGILVFMPRSIAFKCFIPRFAPCFSNKNIYNHGQNSTTQIPTILCTWVFKNVYFFDLKPFRQRHRRRCCCFCSFSENGKRRRGKVGFGVNISFFL